MRQLIFLCSLILIVTVLLILAALGVGSTWLASSRFQFWRLTTCQLPCWNNIVPGTTTFDEAKEQVNHFLDLSGMKFEYSDEYNDGYSDDASEGRQEAYWATNKPNTGLSTSIDITTDGGTISTISFQTLFPGFDPDHLMPSLGDVLAILGPPTCVVDDEVLGEFDLAYVAKNPYNDIHVGTEKLNLNEPIWRFAIGSDNSRGQAEEDCPVRFSSPWRGLYHPEQYLVK